MPYKVSHGRPIQITYSPDEVFSKIQHDEIKFIDLQFTGLTGRFHHTTISTDTFTAQQMKDGLPKLDGSSIVGFTSINDSDLVLKPDPNTYALIPWLVENKTSRLLCDVYWGMGRGRLERAEMILSATLNGKIKLLESISQKHKTKSIVVRFLKEVDQIVGADLEKYGPFKTEDVATLPYENAHALILKNMAMKVRLED